MTCKTCGLPPDLCVCNQDDHSITGRRAALAKKLTGISNEGQTLIRRMNFDEALILYIREKEESIHHFQEASCSQLNAQKRTGDVLRKFIDELEKDFNSVVSILDATRDYAKELKSHPQVMGEFMNHSKIGVNLEKILSAEYKKHYAILNSDDARHLLDFIALYNPTHDCIESTIIEKLTSAEAKAT